MQKRLLLSHEEIFPSTFNHLVAGTEVYDSSSSPEARVYFIDKDQGYFLKKATKGRLQKEADLTSYFHQKGWAQEVLDYFSDDHDWLLAAKVDGEDASSSSYAENPKRLCQVLAETMSSLHQLKAEDCPVKNRTKDYLTGVESGYQAGNFDPHYLFGHQKQADRLVAYQKVKEFSPFLESNTLIHGDFCLPNLILKDWQFQAMIDWDSAGLGDRHIDLFWAVWSLEYNLQTNRYRDYFLDGYGRENINLELLEAIAYFEVFG